MIINNPGHMTKMATMPIQDKNSSKSFFSGTTESIDMYRYSSTTCSWPCDDFDLFYGKVNIGIYIYLIPQLSVYRTIGSLVSFASWNLHS